MTYRRTEFKRCSDTGRRWNRNDDVVRLFGSLFRKNNLVSSRHGSGVVDEATSRCVCAARGRRSRRSADVSTAGDRPGTRRLGRRRAGRHRRRRLGGHASAAAEAHPDDVQVPRAPADEDLLRTEPQSRQQRP